MNKQAVRLSTALAATLLLTGCASEIRDASATDTSATAEAAAPSTSSTRSSTPPVTASPTPELLTEDETCQELAGGEGSLAYRAATWAKSLKDTGVVDDAIYAEAHSITEDADELSEIASWNLVSEVEAVASGPQNLVDAVRDGDNASGRIPAETLSTVTEAATSCLTGQDKEDFSAFMYELVVGEPLVRE
jgi:hypothetical protein